MNNRKNKRKIHSNEEISKESIDLKNSKNMKHKLFNNNTIKLIN